MEFGILSRPAADALNMLFYLQVEEILTTANRFSDWLVSSPSPFERINLERAGVTSKKRHPDNLSVVDPSTPDGQCSPHRGDSALRWCHRRYCILEILRMVILGGSFRTPSVRLDNPMAMVEGRWPQHPIAKKNFKGTVVSNLVERTCLRRSLFERSNRKKVWVTSKKRHPDNSSAVELSTSNGQGSPHRGGLALRWCHH